MIARATAGSIFTLSCTSSSISPAKTIHAKTNNQMGLRILQKILNSIETNCSARNLIIYEKMIDSCPKTVIRISHQYYIIILLILP